MLEPEIDYTESTVPSWADISPLALPQERNVMSMIEQLRQVERANLMPLLNAGPQTVPPVPALESFTQTQGAFGEPSFTNAPMPSAPPPQRQFAPTLPPSMQRPSPVFQQGPPSTLEDAKLQRALAGIRAQEVSTFQREQKMAQLSAFEKAHKDFTDTSMDIAQKTSQLKAEPGNTMALQSLASFMPAIVARVENLHRMVPTVTIEGESPELEAVPVPKEDQAKYGELYLRNKPGQQLRGPVTLPDPSVAPILRQSADQAVSLMVSVLSRMTPTAPVPAGLGRSKIPLPSIEASQIALAYAPVWERWANKGLLSEPSKELIARFVDKFAGLQVGRYTLAEGRPPLFKIGTQKTLTPFELAEQDVEKSIYTRRLGQVAPFFQKLAPEERTRVREHVYKKLQEVTQADEKRYWRHVLDTLGGT